jgi:soluble lytic murein transglycosylase-like protein
MCNSRSSMRGRATSAPTQVIPAATAKHRASLCAAVLAAALLSACAGLPFGANGAAGQPDQTGTAAPLATRSERIRAMTARDILLEWGVAGAGPKARKKSKTSGAERALEAASLTEYSASIQEIMNNATCRSCEQKPYHRMVQVASTLHGVPSSLIHAVIQKESGYNPDARSRQNARGLMQVTPDTARFVGVETGDRLYDPQTNINAGTAYLKYLMLTHDSVDHVLAAYNAGPGNVRKYKGVPPFSETRRYISDVKKFFAALAHDLL